MIRPGTALRWHKAGGQAPGFSPSRDAAWGRRQGSRQLPNLQEFLNRRDYLGAITLLRFEKKQGIGRQDAGLWLVYCYFHAGLYPQAIAHIDRLLGNTEDHKAPSERRTQNGEEVHVASPLIASQDQISGLSRLPTENADSSAVVEGQDRTPDNDKTLSAQEDDDDIGSDDGAWSADGDPDARSTLHLYKGICLYAMYMFKRAKQEALLSRESELRRRLLVCIAYHENDEDLDEMLEELDADNLRDQMACAAIAYMRGRAEEACDIYRRLLNTHPEYQALKVYIAMCLFKADMCEMSRNLVKEYQATHSSSLVASNLLACCLYSEGAGASAMRIYHLLGEEARREEAFFIEHNDLLRHNAAVFQKGERGLSVWGPLVNLLHEARLNLALIHLRQGNYSGALDLMRDFVPTSLTELVTRASAFMLAGQANHSQHHLNEAEKLFGTIGSAETGTDLLVRSESMFYYHFLRQDYGAAVAYADKLEPFCGSEPSFRWNKALALAECGYYGEAKRAMQKIDDQEYVEDPAFLRWLCRLCVATGDCAEALRLCIQQGGCARNQLLKEVAEDCYSIGDYYFALKAFAVLDKAEENPLLWPALRGSAAGFLLKLDSHAEDASRITEVLSLLRECSAPKVAKIALALKSRGRERGIDIQ